MVGHTHTHTRARKQNRDIIRFFNEGKWGTAVAQWLRCCATNGEVAGSIQDGVIGIFY